MHIALSDWCQTLVCGVWPVPRCSRVPRRSRLAFRRRRVAKIRVKFEANGARAELEVVTQQHRASLPSASRSSMSEPSAFMSARNPTSPNSERIEYLGLNGRRGLTSAPSSGSLRQACSASTGNARVVGSFLLPTLAAPITRAYSACSPMYSLMPFHNSRSGA